MSGCFPVCQTTMIRERFQQIKFLLIFDDTLRGNKNDVLAPIRAIFEQFKSRCRLFNVPSHFLTIDEQLLQFHGRVKFRQYIPSNPGKFGIKVFWIVFYAKCCNLYWENNNYVRRGIYSLFCVNGIMKQFLNSGCYLTG